MTTYLFSQESDWETFNRAFITEAKTEQVWEYVNDVGRLPWPEAPTPPNISEMTMSPTAKARYLQENPTVERASFIARARAVTDLTNADAATFTAANNHYEVLRKRHERLVLGRAKLKKWINDNLHPRYARNLAPATIDDVGEIYDRLRAQCASTIRNEMLTVHGEYRAHVQDIGKSTKRLGEWAVDWEQLMGKAIAVGVPDALNTETWMSDFLKATASVSQLNTWAISQGDFLRDAVRDGKKTYIDVGAKLREHLTQNNLYGSKAIKAAFPALHGRDADADASQEDKAVKDRKDRPRRGRGSQNAQDSRKRRRSDSDSTSGPRKVCEACLRPGHSLERCFHAFPEEAPRSWNHDNPAAKMVMAWIGSNAELRAKVERIRAEKRAPKGEAAH